MRDMVSIWQQDCNLQKHWKEMQRDIARLISTDELCPTDKMNWESVKKLFDIIEPLRQKAEHFPAAVAG